MDSAEQIKKIVKSVLSPLDLPHFRFMFFVKFSENQHFLFIIFDSKSGFIENLEGIKLFVSDYFKKILKENESYELNGSLNTDYPFLYEGFANIFSLYLKKVYAGEKCIGVVEFIIEREFVSQQLKDTIQELLKKAERFIYDAYISILTDSARKDFCLNALNMLKVTRPRTFYHSFRVADLSFAIGKFLNLDRPSLKRLYYAALIHDVGELWIPNEVLDKKDKLTQEELELIKKHPKNLEDIFLYNPFLEDIVQVAIYHHERENGTGYYQLKGSDIPIDGKILSLSEFVDGLHTDRPDRKALGIDKITEVVKKSAGELFDESLAESAIPIIKKLYKGFIDIKVELISVGKPVTLLFYRKGELILIKGVVEYSTGEILGVGFKQKEGENLHFGDIVRLQIPIFSIIADIKAKVITKSSSMLNLMIKNAESIEDKPLEVFWEFEIIVIPIKVSSIVLSPKESKEKLFPMKTIVFGSKSLMAMADSFDLNIGDTVILKAKPLGETITIPAIVSDVVGEKHRTSVRFEYFGLNEAEDAKIHRAIYSKQVKLVDFK